VKAADITDRFRVTDAERAAIPAVAKWFRATPAEDRRAYKAKHEAARRAAAGATPRSKSLSAKEPWKPEGVHRRTYERRQKRQSEQIRGHPYILHITPLYTTYNGSPVADEPRAVSSAPVEPVLAISISDTPQSETLPELAQGGEWPLGGPSEPTRREKPMPDLPWSQRVGFSDYCRLVSWRGIRLRSACAVRRPHEPNKFEAIAARREELSI
jgi:hypothetical protein